MNELLLAAAEDIIMADCKIYGPQRAGFGVGASSRSIGQTIAYS